MARPPLDKSGRRCSKCGNETTINKCAGKQYFIHGKTERFLHDSLYWYKDGKGGWLCLKCYRSKRREVENMYVVDVKRNTGRKIKRLRYANEKIPNVIDRITNYYIENRFDAKTRKQILAN